MLGIPCFASQSIPSVSEVGVIPLLEQMLLGIIQFHMVFFLKLFIIFYFLLVRCPIVGSPILCTRGLFLGLAWVMVAALRVHAQVKCGIYRQRDFPFAKARMKRFCRFIFRVLVNFEGETQNTQVAVVK